MRIATVSLLVCCCLSAVSAQWLETTIPLPDSLGPFEANGCQVWDSSDNKLFLGGDGGVLIIDGATNERLAIVPTSGSIRAFCCSPAEHKVYCATDSGTVVVLNGATNQVVTTIPAGEYPYAVCYNSQDNKVYSSNRSSSSVTIIDCHSDTVLATVSGVPYPDYFCYASGSNKVYCGTYYGGVNAVTVIDGVGDTVLIDVPIGDAMSSFA